MKKIITVTLFFCLISFINAQTKLISHKSHSGNSKSFHKAMNTFGIASSNFGGRSLPSYRQIISSVTGANLYITDIYNKRNYILIFKDISSSGNVLCKFKFRGAGTNDFSIIKNRILNGFDNVPENKVIEFKLDMQSIGLKYTNKNHVKLVQFKILTDNNDETRISKMFTKKEIELLFTDSSVKKSCNLPLIEKEEDTKKQSIPLVLKNSKPHSNLISFILGGVLILIFTVLLYRKRLLKV